MTTANAEPIDIEELGKWLESVSPEPFQGQRMVWKQSDWDTSEAQGDYHILDKNEEHIATIRHGGMGRKITEQEAEANSELFFLAPRLAARVVADAATKREARTALEWAQTALWDSPEREDDACSPVCDDENCVHQALRTALAKLEAAK